MITTHQNEVDRLRRDAWDNRNWTAVQARLAAEKDDRDAVRRTGLISRMQRSADLRNR